MPATEEALVCISVPASTDLSTKQFYLVKVNSSGQLALAGDGEPAIGVLQDKPNAQGKAGSVAISGRTLCVAGDSITAGASVKSNAAGKAVSAIAATVNTSNTGAASDAVVGSNVIGTALEGAVANDIFPLLIEKRGAVPTTAA